MNKKIIYDFGSNNGDDIPYYLLKSDLVVAVEANPALCSHIKSRFKEQISNGNLMVENYVLNVGDPSSDVPFYLNTKNHVLSQLPKPVHDSHDFEEVLLPSKNVIKIIQKYGEPFYIKIDIEHYDVIVLRELLINNIFAPYISCESHSINVFATLVALGKYNAFKLVDGRSVSDRYRNSEIITKNGNVKYSFPYHSAGPFGNDISGPWMTPDNFFQLLAMEGLGWKDIHASNIENADVSYVPLSNAQPKRVY
jgi:FkbM family methyltransferase